MNKIYIYILIFVIGCNPVNNTNIYLEDEIKSKINKYNIQLLKVENRNEQISNMEEHNKLNNYEYSTYSDSIRNIKITEINEQLITIVSAHNETTFNLKHHINNAQQFLDESIKSKPKNLAVDWIIYENEIYKWFEFEKLADSAAYQWKKRVIFFNNNQEADSTDRTE